MKSIDIMSLKSFFSDPSLHSHRHHLFSVRLFFFIGFFVHCGCHCYCFLFVHVCLCARVYVVAASNGFVYLFYFGLRVCLCVFFFAIRFYSASPHISILLLFWKCCYVQHSRRDNHCSNVHAEHVNSSEKPPPLGSASFEKD